MFHHGENLPLIDYFAIGLTHGLLALAVWRLLLRADLDSEGGGKQRRKPWHRQEPSEAAPRPGETPGDA